MIHATLRAAFWRIGVVIFVVELLIMLAFNFFLPRIPESLEPLLDAFLLTLFSAPLIYFWIVRPTDSRLAVTIATLEAMRDEANQANRSKSEFLANMSHEIRTPMTAILGYTELLKPDHEHSLVPEQRKEAIDTVQRNGRHLLEVLNDILDISKIEAGKLTIERIPCSPTQVMSEVASMMRVRAEEKKLDLRLDFGSPIPTQVITDPTRLRQILINIIGNAIKFTKVGGVRLIAQLIDQDTDDPKLQFRIVDSGIGLSGDQVEKLFQPFSQADTSTTRKFGGTGLGLSISKRLAESLGGKIEVESTIGEGSTFVVTVATGPLDGVRMTDDLSEALKPATVKQEIKPTKIHGRILLVEDGIDNQRLISYLLKKAGATVEIAENGRIGYEKAIAAAKLDKPFDVILMDMQMPEMDGYEAASKLRSMGYTGPIIALTAHAMKSDRDKCLAAGCDDYASKPIDRGILLETVLHHLHHDAVATAAV